MGKNNIPAVGMNSLRRVWESDILKSVFRDVKSPNDPFYMHKKLHWFLG